MNKLCFKKLSYEWIETKRLSVKYSTYIKYKNIINNHLLKLYDNREIENWKEEDYKIWYLSFVKREDLSKSMKMSIKYVLKSILIYSEEKYHLKHINLTFMKITTDKQEVCVLNEDEIKKLSVYCQKNINTTALAIYISMYTGMRIGEICGLKWEDIFFDEGIIYVKRTVQRIQKENSCRSKTEKMIFSPKTRSSRRIVVLSDFLIDYIINYKRVFGPSSQNCFIISNSLEIPEVRNLQRNFKNVCSFLGLKINFHVLRHSFATNCIKYDIDIKTISELLGHSNISTTLNLYVHPSIEHKRKQINKMPSYSVVD